MIASDTAWSEPDTDRRSSGSGTDWSYADERAPAAPPRPQAYRRLWQPPGRTPRRQALGQPYVWDGGSDEREALRSPAARPEESAGRGRSARRGPPPAADTLARPAWITERAVIGDHLRELKAWCQIGACIARHTDAEALGEADIKNRAVAAGWCVDLFGRMVCPSCQQRYPVWSARPLVERDQAVWLRAMTADPQDGRYQPTR